MHPFPLITLPLALLASACVSSVNLVQESIVFKPVIGHEVRSDDMSVPFPEDKTFGVWAMDNQSVEYISDSEISCNGGLWSSESLPFWPTSSSLTFYAYSPYGLPVEFSGKALILNDFDVTKDGDDFLFAQTASGLTSSHGDVKLPFSHALSRMDMRIASGYGTDVQLRIDRIVMRNVATVGNFDSSKFPQWTADESSVTDIVFYDSERDGQFLAGPQMQFIGDLRTILPQRLESTIELQYAFRIDEGDWLEGQTDSTEKIIIVWEPGRYYTYSLTINEQKLSYTTGIGHWSEKK